MHILESDDVPSVVTLVLRSVHFQKLLRKNQPVPTTAYVWSPFVNNKYVATMLNQQCNNSE